jgi:branched-chain amino acid transport system ATP-binding protein
VAESIIEFDKVVAGYSPSVTILNELTLDARKSEITLLIGPNGAGKSTVLKTLFGMLVPRSGEVRFEGKRVNGKTQRELLAEGIAFVPQGRNLFGSLRCATTSSWAGSPCHAASGNGRIEEILRASRESGSGSTIRRRPCPAESRSSSKSAARSCFDRACC